MRAHDIEITAGVVALTLLFESGAVAAAAAAAFPRLGFDHGLHWMSQLMGWNRRLLVLPAVLRQEGVEVLG